MKAVVPRHRWFFWLRIVLLLGVGAWLLVIHLRRLSRIESAVELEADRLLRRLGPVHRPEKEMLEEESRPHPPSVRVRNAFAPGAEEAPSGTLGKSSEANSLPAPR